MGASRSCGAATGAVISGQLIRCLQPLSLPLTGMTHEPIYLAIVGFGKSFFLEKGSFQKISFSRDSGEYRDCRDSREPPDCGKQRRIRTFSKDSRKSRDFGDARDPSTEKTPFVIALFPLPKLRQLSIEISRIMVRYIAAHILGLYRGYSWREWPGSS